MKIYCHCTIGEIKEKWLTEFPCRLMVGDIIISNSEVAIPMRVEKVVFKGKDVRVSLGNPFDSATEEQFIEYYRMEKERVKKVK